MNTENARLLKTRRALFGCFLVLGFVMASWIVRTPSIRDALSASTAEMGLILFGFSLGSMGGILLASNIVARIGADRAVCAGMTLALAGLVVCRVAHILLWLGRLAWVWPWSVLEWPKPKWPSTSWVCMWNVV